MIFKSKKQSVNKARRRRAMAGCLTAPGNASHSSRSTRTPSSCPHSPIRVNTQPHASCASISQFMSNPVISKRGKSIPLRTRVAVVLTVVIAGLSQAEASRRHLVSRQTVSRLVRRVQHLPPNAPPESFFWCPQGTKERTEDPVKDALCCVWTSMDPFWCSCSTGDEAIAMISNNEAMNYTLLEIISVFI